MYINFDKLLLGVGIVLVLGSGKGVFDLRRIFSVVIPTTAACAAVLIVAGMASNYIAFDPKWPPQTALWMANNLLIVCLAEEAFFRRYLQEGLAQLTKSPYVGLVLASLLFGLAHFRGGISYVALSAIAGLFYGYSYLKTERLEASIFTHFLLNTTHFLLFTYPQTNWGQA